MKKKFLVFALLSALSPALIGQQTKESTSDAAIEAPPGNPASTSPGTKPKRSKPVGSSVGSRHAATAEIKTFSFNRNFGGERLARPLIVQNTQADSKRNSQLQEDLAIMSRIVEKAAADYREEHEEAAGIPILALGGGKGIRALYLEDYGVLLTLNVNIPLQPELKSELVEDKSQAGANEEWVDARNELFGERRASAVRGEHPRRDFDQHQLEEFRDGLIEALRSAANIRNLRDTDWITLVVRGRGSLESEPLDVIVRNEGFSAANREPFRIGSIDDRRSEASTMVLRIKKSAVDEFGRQKASAEEFRKKVAVTLY